MLLWTLKSREFSTRRIIEVTCFLRKYVTSKSAYVSGAGLIMASHVARRGISRGRESHFSC